MRFYRWPHSDAYVPRSQSRTFTPGLNETAMNPIVKNSNAVIATPFRVKAKEIGFPVYITNPISTAYFEVS
jgi:hypothetical protein